MNLSRAGLVTGVILVAVVLQVALFNLFAVNGVVPNLALLVVVAASIAVDPSSARSSGSPQACCSTSPRPPTTWPAVGRSRSWWSPSWPAGCVPMPGAARSPGLATVAVCSFVATSIFALSGVILGDHALRRARWSR